MRYLAALMLVLALLAPMALGDPLPDEIAKFQQLPMIATPINGAVYFGHDEISMATATPTAPQFFVGNNWMADDFADYTKGQVVHVQWWGSYLRGQAGTVPGFLIEFLSDKPAEPTGLFSRPDQLLSAQIVTVAAGVPLSSGSGTFTESPVSGGSTVEPVYMYNAELRNPFPQEPNTVYWLKIVALTGNQDTVWGWHNRDYTIMDPLAVKPPDLIPGESIVGTIPDPIGGAVTPIWHFQDDAVQGAGITVTLFDAAGLEFQVQEDPNTSVPQTYLNLVDGPGLIVGAEPTFPGIGQYSKDLAFVLYTVPEPTTMALLALGGLTLIRRRRR